MENTAGIGHLAIIGLGPGSRDLLAPRALQTIQTCDTVIGYRVYIEQIQDLLTGKDVHVSELTHEVERATLAVQQARDGHRVCIVSSGDAGIYGMAGLVLDLLSALQEELAGDVLPAERMEASPHKRELEGIDACTEGEANASRHNGLVPIDPPCRSGELASPVCPTRIEPLHSRPRASLIPDACTEGEANASRQDSLVPIDPPCRSGELASPVCPTRIEPLSSRSRASLIPTVEVVPGISALNAAAALLGAPLMHDFAVISLSDLLTPWATIAQRLSAAAAADFVIVLYNPISRKRHWQLGEARRLLLASQPATTPVGLVRNAYRPGQQVWLTTLEHLLDYEIDMFTTVVIGNSCTRMKQGRMITPRGYERYNAL